MTVVYGGSLTLGGCMPPASAIQASLDLSLAATMPKIQADLAGALAVSLEIAPPPSLAELIAALQAALAAAQALLVPPTVDVAATLALVANLQATLATLQASLALSVSFGNLLSQAGIHFYAYAGRADELGAEMSSQLSAGLPGGAGGTENIAGVILAANDGGAIAALQALFPGP